MALAHAPVEPSLVGAVLSRKYKLTREIGRGGMGAVYAAEPVGGGERVAIKILHPYFVSDEHVMTRFMDEGRTCTRLVHPNIRRVHDCLAAEDGSPYLVMDLLEGVPLSAYTKDGGRVSLGHAIPILQGMLAGVEAAHASGVVHRDLKPGNVFLARTGGVFGVKLLDFGIAKVMDAAGGMGTKTRTGALLGTPAYMSPEQVKSAKDVDGRTDLWSIGVMAYEMLTGRVAFAAPTEYARLAAVLSTQPVPIESIDPDLAVAAPFIQRALEKDRELRFQTAREMSDALAKLAPAGSLRPPDSEVSTPLYVPVDRGVARAAGSSRGASAAKAPDASPWSLVTDNPPPPTEPSLDLASGARSPRPRDVLSAPVGGSPQSSTLASPNRGPAPTNPPAAHAPPVVVVADEEGASARAAVAAPERGVATSVVAVLVLLALAAGFLFGVLYARPR